MVPQSVFLAPRNRCVGWLCDCTKTGTNGRTNRVKLAIVAVFTTAITTMMVGSAVAALPPHRHHHEEDYDLPSLNYPPLSTIPPYLPTYDPNAGITLPLHTSGRWIVDHTGTRVKLACVNWYGAEEMDFVVGGLQSQSLSAIVSQIRQFGFNCVRLPWSNQMVEQNPVINNGTVIAANPQLAGLAALDILDRIIMTLAAANILIILDNHMSIGDWCCDGTDGNGLWYNPQYSTQQWLDDWTLLVKRYEKIPHVIGADVRNELRQSCPAPTVDGCRSSTSSTSSTSSESTTSTEGSFSHGTSRAGTISRRNASNAIENATASPKSGSVGVIALLLRRPVTPVVGTTLLNVSDSSTAGRPTFGRHHHQLPFRDEKGEEEQEDNEEDGYSKERDEQEAERREYDSATITDITTRISITSPSNSYDSHQYLQSNFPSGNGCVSPSWASGDPATDWKLAAEMVGNAILDINPNLLVFIEGLNYALDWSFITVTNYPVLNVPDQLVYSVHDYSWDHNINSYDDLRTQLDAAWGFLFQNGDGDEKMPYVAPVWLGEFGTCHTGQSCVRDSQGAGLWWQCMWQYLKYFDLDWSYWALDGTQSRGTGRTFGSEEVFGMLNVSWSGIALPALYQDLYQIVNKTQGPTADRIVEKMKDG